MSTNPIAGNQNFRSVDSSAGQLAKLDVGSGTISTLTSDSISADSVSTSGKGSVVTRYAYAPSSFSTLGVGASFSLMNKPGLVAATATTDDIFTLPALVSILRVVVSNNGTTVTSGGSATVSTGLASSLNGAIAQAFTVGTTLALMNSSAMVGGGTATELTGANVFGNTGEVPAGAGVNAILATASEVYVSVTGAVAALTAGDLKLEITYFNP